MTKQIITIDSIQYKLSPTDGELLQQILSRSSMVKEILTDAVVERLIGHKKVVYYNLDTHAWNTEIYNGYKLDTKDSDINNIMAFKNAMDNKKWFNQKYEFVAPVIMTIEGGSCLQEGKLYESPRYTQYGRGAVGNIIVRNKLTKKCELFGKDWIGVKKFYLMEQAAIYGMKQFAMGVVRDSDFRAMLVASHMR